MPFRHFAEFSSPPIRCLDFQLSSLIATLPLRHFHAVGLRHIDSAWLIADAISAAFITPPYHATDIAIDISFDYTLPFILWFQPPGFHFLLRHCWLRWWYADAFRRLYISILAPLPPLLLLALLFISHYWSFHYLLIFHAFIDNDIFIFIAFDISR